MPKKISLFNFTPDQIYQKFIQKNLPDVYIGSLYKIHCHTVFLLASTKALDKVLSSFTVYEPKVLVSNTYGNATKLLLELEDKNKIEMNIMHFKYGVTLCISSQVGCNMGCKFCASGVLKKVRNLTSEEMMTQVTLANKILIRTQERITNVVIMGIGEPFDNYANLVKFIKIITYRYGISLGFKHITISTCGICNKILAFAKLFPSVNLTISLHATNDKVRNEIMPINRK
jgi:23S rRNA (adenine2503-C2)-methyltransferase